MLSITQSTGNPGFRNRSKKQTDEHGHTMMTLDYLKQLAVEQKGYRTPSLNDNLYLHYKGFHSISEAIHAYSGLKALWLEGNCISSIEHLDTLKHLKCLYLQENCFTVINQEIQHLTNLHTLNLSNNLLTDIPNELKHLSNLSSLHLSNNRLGPNMEAIAVLKECASLSVLDLHHNQLADNKCLTEILWKIPNLAVLTLHHNPLLNSFVQYRRTSILNMINLTFLDDRPVSDNDRQVTMAWSIGGHDAEQAEIGKIKQLEAEKRELDFKLLANLQQENKRRQSELSVQHKDLYESTAPDPETQLFNGVPKLVKFYNDMVSKGLGEIVETNALHRQPPSTVHSNVPIRKIAKMDVEGTNLLPASPEPNEETGRRPPLIEELSQDTEQLFDNKQISLTDSINSSTSSFIHAEGSQESELGSDEKSRIFDLTTSIACQQPKKVLIQDLGSTSDSASVAATYQSILSQSSTPKDTDHEVLMIDSTMGTPINSHHGTIPPPSTPMCVDECMTPPAFRQLSELAAAPNAYQHGTVAPPSTPMYCETFPATPSNGHIDLPHSSDHSPRPLHSIPMPEPYHTQPPREKSSLLRHVLKTTLNPECPLMSEISSVGGTGMRNRKGLKLIPNLGGGGGGGGGTAPPCTPIPSTPTHQMLGGETLLSNRSMLPPETPTSQRMPRAPYSSPARPLHQCDKSPLTGSGPLVDPTEALAASTRIFNSHAMNRIGDPCGPESVHLPVSDDDEEEDDDMNDEFDTGSRLDSGLFEHTPGLKNEVVLRTSDHEDGQQGDGGLDLVQVIDMDAATSSKRDIRHHLAWT